jgi:hypothetical protein
MVKSANINAIGLVARRKPQARYELWCLLCGLYIKGNPRPHCKKVHGLEAAQIMTKAGQGRISRPHYCGLKTDEAVLTKRDFGKAHNEVLKLIEERLLLKCKVPYAYSVLAAQVYIRLAKLNLAPKSLKGEWDRWTMDSFVNPILQRRNVEPLRPVD